MTEGQNGASRSGRLLDNPRKGLMNDSNDDQRRPNKRHPDRRGRSTGSGDGAGRRGENTGRSGIGQGDRPRTGRPSGSSARSRDGSGDSRPAARNPSRGQPGASRHAERGAAGPAGTDGTDAQPTDATPDPPIDSEVTGEELDEEMLAGLGSLSGGLAKRVAQHLVMAGMLLDEDPEQAYEHAQAARRRTARVGVVREVVGVTAYAAGKYAEALAEFRAARRITGSDAYLPMMADCERGLGRPRRALELARDPAVERLDPGERIEMLIVAAGARRDLGEIDAAVVSLQVPELRSTSTEDWVARLRYAYADALEAAGRRDDAARWFGRAAEADVDALTDAAERAVALGSSTD
jgi:hypothetical protein